MTTYEANGTCMRGGKTEKYSKKVSAPNEKLAKEKIYSLLGSEHKVGRAHITIETLKVIK